MYLKKFEYFILDSSVAGTLLLMALAIRIEAINAGFDQFSSNIIFISVFIISTGLYISMQIALYEIIIVRGNLAVSNFRKMSLPTYEIQSKDYGYRKFNKKIHTMEQNL